MSDRESPERRKMAFDLITLQESLSGSGVRRLLLLASVSSHNFIYPEMKSLSKSTVNSIF